MKKQTHQRLLRENYMFQKKHRRESSQGILSGLDFNISDQLGENCFEDVLHSLIKWKKKKAPAIVSRKHRANMATSHTRLPTWPYCESLPVYHF